MSCRSEQSSGGFESFAGLLDFPMSEAVEVSALRAGPAAGFEICALKMSHFIYDSAFDATSRFAAHEFLLPYGLHKILSMESLSSTAQHAFQRRPEFRDRVWLWKSGSDDLERFGATQIRFISPGGHNDAGFRLQSADLFNKG